jgi:RND family efflux transporter MFP subunit
LVSSRPDPILHAEGAKTGAPAGGVDEQSWARLAAAASIEEFGAAWLTIAGTGLAARRGVLVVRRPESERFAPAAFFPAGKPCGPFLADAAERALYDAKPLAIEDGPRLGVAYPLALSGRLEAIVAFEWESAPDTPREQLLRSVQWGLPWLEMRLRPAAGAPAGPSGTLQRVLAAGSAVEASRTAATELAHALGCDRVAIGIARGDRVELLAISNTAQFDPRLGLARAIEELMADARAAGGPLHRPAVDAPGRALAVSAGACVFSFERAAAFDAQAIEGIQAACTPLAPALALQEAGTLPSHRKAWREARAFLTHWTARDAGRRRFVAAAVVAALVFLVFGKGEFRVAGDATLEGSVRRQMSAPFDGYVASSGARAGDLVKQGTLIAALDDRDIGLERLRWAGQRAQYARQLNEASAKHDRGQMQVVQAQLEQAEAQMQLLDEQLRRARIVAPFDGLVVAGDLSQSVGGAVKKGDTLFEMTPLKGYRVVVQVDESEIDTVAAGQKGTLLLGAIAGESFPVTVTMVTPVAHAKDGRNAFRVEAALEGPAERLRPGMEGVAKIETGSRNLVWIWTHRFTNWARLKLWSLLP